MLREGAPARPDALAAFKLARRWFIQGRKIDMGELGAELEVSRATLFRWVGNRDQLTAEILIDLGAKTFRGLLDRHADKTGPARVAAVFGDFIRSIADAPYFVDFVHRDPEKALRLLTTKASPVQRRTIALVENLLNEEIPEPDDPSEIAHHDLAYLIVRIGESLLYTDVITGEPPNPDIVRQAVYALVR